MQRRRFIAEIGALAALPQTGTADTTSAGEIAEDRSVTDDKTYSVTDCAFVPGGLNNVLTTADMNDGPLEVEGIHEEGGWSGVGLRWTSGTIEVGTGLAPNDARDLAARLVVAADAAEEKFDGWRRPRADSRCPHRIRRVLPEYEVGGVAYGSLDVYESAFYC